jgi:hypothetical protein
VSKTVPVETRDAYAALGHYLVRQQDVPLDAETFYRWLAAKRAEEVSAGVSL